MLASMQTTLGNNEMYGNMMPVVMMNLKDMNLLLYVGHVCWLLQAVLWRLQHSSGVCFGLLHAC